MSTQVTRICDWCKKEIKGKAFVWVTLWGFLNNDNDLHFCNISCLSEWAKEHAR